MHACVHAKLHQLCLTLCEPMDCSMPSFPILHYLPEFAQIHVHQGDHANDHLILCCPFSYLQSFPTSGSFPKSQVFTSGDQSIGVLASASVFPVNIQSLFPLGLTGLIFLLSKGLSRIFSSAKIQKHQFFGAQPSLWSNSHIHT